MPLEYVKPPEHPYANFALYGPPKTGKTAGACSAPGGVLLLNADLPNATRYAHSQHNADGRIKEVHVNGMQALVDVHEVIHQTPTFDVVVVDPIGELHRRLLEEASNRAVRPTLNQYGDVSTQLERFCRMLCEAPVNVVFVFHETASKDEVAGVFERLPFTGTSNPALGSKIMGMVDVLGYTAVMETEDAGRKYVAQLISNNGRRGGDRWDVLGDWRPLDLADWLTLMNCHTIGNSPVEPEPKTNAKKNKEAVAA